ncbi:MAG TPA: hypothetical protein VGQ83_02390 [Polyangia bacterium]|jgi:hypothetical protein
MSEPLIGSWMDLFATVVKHEFTAVWATCWDVPVATAVLRCVTLGLPQPVPVVQATPEAILAVGNTALTICDVAIFRRANLVAVVMAPTPTQSVFVAAVLDQRYLANLYLPLAMRLRERLEQLVTPPAASAEEPAPAPRDPCTVLGIDPADAGDPEVIKRAHRMFVELHEDKWASRLPRWAVDRVQEPLKLANWAHDELLRRRAKKSA